MYICKHCEEEITELNYSVPVSEYGEMNITNQQYETSDTEIEGEYLYSCPICSYESHCKENIYKEVTEEDSENTSQENSGMEERNQNPSPTTGKLIHNETQIQRCESCGNPCPKSGCACKEI